MLPKILYVDDEEVNLKVFQLLFRNTYEVITCDDPTKALQMLEDNEVDLIVTDYKMPILNGMELIEQVKAKHPSKLCIILSGFLESEVVMDKGKIFAFISKPLQKAQLIACFEKAFNELG